MRSTPHKLAASVAILAGVAAFVSFGVFSAFSETKSNSSSLKAANFGLTQAPSTGLLDNILNLIPGDTITRCVKLTNTGDTPVTVTAKPSMANVSGALRSALGFTMQEVSGISGTATDAQIKSCTGAVGNDADYVIGTAGSTVLGSALADTPLAGDGTGGRWDAGETHYYRVFMTLPSSVTDLALGGDELTANVNFLAEQIAGSAK